MTVGSWRNLSLCSFLLKHFHIHCDLVRITVTLSLALRQSLPWMCQNFLIELFTHTHKHMHTQHIRSHLLTLWLKDKKGTSYIFFFPAHLKLKYFSIGPSVRSCSTLLLNHLEECSIKWICEYLRLSSWQWHKLKWVCMDHVELKAVWGMTWIVMHKHEKMSFRFLKYSFICECTLISNTSKSNSIR